MITLDDVLCFTRPKPWWDECDCLGREQAASAALAGQAQVNGAEIRDPVEISARGVCGERIVCEATGIAWVKRTWRSPDDVGGVQVKTSGRHLGDLLLQRNNPPGMYVLVWDLRPRLVIVGQVDAALVMREDRYGDHFRNRRPCFLLPWREMSAFDPFVWKEQRCE